MGGGGLGIPGPGAAPGQRAVAFAAGLIDRSGKAPVIEAALAHRTGRRRPLPVRAVLTALLCLALDDRPLFLAEATRLLFCQLPPACRRLLGVPGTAPTPRAFQNAYRRVRYCFHAILSVVDPSPLPKNRRLTGDELKARARPMTPDQATAARGRLEALASALLEASVSVLTEDERAAFDGGTGLDATPVPLFSRGPSRRAGLCASDPDSGWYVREGDHREREDDKGKPLRKIAWALEATIAATARPPGAPPACPDLAIGLALARPGEDPGGTGARVLASAAARGHKAGWLGYDRACTAAVPGRFRLPARALGHQPVMDYRAGQLGIQASTGGAILVEGTWYCPALPGPLITATAGLRDHAIDRELHDQQIAARAACQLKRKDGPDTDGYQRLSCPALGSHPGLMCPLRPGSPRVWWRLSRMLPELNVTKAEDVPLDYLAQHKWLVGSPDTVAKKLEVDLEVSGGFGTIIGFTFDYLDQAEQYRHNLELIGTEVLPRIKGIVHETEPLSALTPPEGVEPAVRERLTVTATRG